MLKVKLVRKPLLYTCMRLTLDRRLSRAFPSFLFALNFRLCNLSRVAATASPGQARPLLQHPLNGQPATPLFQGNSCPLPSHSSDSSPLRSPRCTNHRLLVQAMSSGHGQDCSCLLLKRPMRAVSCLQGNRFPFAWRQVPTSMIIPVGGISTSPPTKSFPLHACSIHTLWRKASHADPIAHHL